MHGPALHVLLCHLWRWLVATGDSDVTAGGSGGRHMPATDLAAHPSHTYSNVCKCRSSGTCIWAFEGEVLTCGVGIKARSLHFIWACNVDALL